ncbi:uracil-DNA glycosylase family protein [Halorussus marinus]|uniref:uracil-DNA glycosylase family protein n=1 Tax=Halorussus marinus TaxID=2505976 RepID=UPI001091EFD4|nr:uracil-DNA glycosylase family protein [Halorussus marinus]
MKNVTDRITNPFDMRPPCPGAEGEQAAVFGYGDANADFHVVGDHPGVHGGCETGVPFTGSPAGERLRSVLNEVGLVADRDGDGDGPAVANLFLSYRYMCCLADDRAPTDREYDDLEPFFDAELRAIAAHVLLPVGEAATRHVLATYGARAALVDDRGMAELHADHVPGSGFLVVPIREPTEWADADRERLAASLSELLDSDYRQTADLSRFLAGDETYEVR